MEALANLGESISLLVLSLSGTWAFIQALELYVRWHVGRVRK